MCAPGRVLGAWPLLLASQGLVIYTPELLELGTIFMGVLICSKYCWATGHLNGCPGDPQIVFSSVTWGKYLTGLL